MGIGGRGDGRLCEGDDFVAYDGDAAFVRGVELEETGTKEGGAEEIANEG